MTVNVATDSAVVFTELTKRYGATTALDRVSLSFPRATVIGLIGRNGSGKTTLLHHATGLMLPSSGQCLTFGTPSNRLTSGELARIGTVSQHGALVDWMSVQRLVRYVAGFYSQWDQSLERDLLQRLELDPFARVGALSPGNRQRLQLVLALGHHPELLLLDEPLADLDPAARTVVLQILLEVFERDRPTIVVSSHLLHDIEPLITRLVCLEKGRVTANDELDALKEQHGVNLEQLFPLLTGASALVRSPVGV
jgi:ABC-2 type transport system ATP-binding protein